jgi:hypothetical protein
MVSAVRAFWSAAKAALSAPVGYAKASRAAKDEIY